MLVGGDAQVAHGVHGSDCTTGTCRICIKATRGRGGLGWVGAALVLQMLPARGWGPCTPPAAPPNAAPRFVIPAKRL